MEAVTKIRRFFGMPMLSAVAGLAGVVVLLVLTLINDFQDARQNAQVEVENISRLLDEHAYATMQKADLLLRETQRHVRPADMRLDRGASDSRKQELHALLQSQRESTPEVAVIHITDAKGNHIYSSLDKVPRINIADRYHFRRHQDDAKAGLVISPPLVSRTTGKWTLILTRRIDFEDGSFAGIINVILNLEYFYDFYHSINLGTQGLLALYDKETRLAARQPKIEKDLGKVTDIYARTYIDKGINRATYQDKSPLDGVERLYSFRQVADLPLFVIAGIAEDDYLADSYRHLWQYSIGALIFGIVVTGFGLRQKQAENTLRRSEEKFRTVADFTYDWEYWLGPSREIRYISPSCKRVTGYSPEEFEADPELFNRIVFPADLHHMDTHLRDDVYHDESLLYFRIVHRNGGIRWIAHGCRAVYGENGQFLGRRVSNRDDTERKLAEDALNLFKLTLDQTLDCIFMFREDDFRFIYVNEGAIKQVGYTQAELLGMTPLDIKPEFTLERFQKMVQPLQEGTQASLTFETIHRHKDGHDIPVEVFLQLVRNEEAGSRFMAIVRDITERKLAEQELKRSNAELEQFAYAVSHDMRQPLRMVSSYLQLLEKALHDRLDAETRQYFAFALDGARRMDSMILALLDFSRVGRKTEPMALLETRTALEEALAYLGPELSDGGGNVQVSGDWPTLVVSRDEMVRLFQNLVGNALKYHEEGHAPQVDVHGQTLPKVWRCEVRDHGVGIDPAQIDRLFKVFSRLQARTRFDGTGVGLALCRKIVEHHGGRIGVESEGEGKGSTFWIELPLVATPQQPAESSP